LSFEERACSATDVPRCGAWATLRLGELLVALEVGDLSFEPEGVVLTIRRSKTDREGAGATVAVPVWRRKSDVFSRGAAELAGGCGHRRGARFSPDRSPWPPRADVDRIERWRRSWRPGLPLPALR
jgi:hypothetical protein